MLLGHALAHEWEHLEERGVGDGRRTLHAGDLRGVLPLPQRLDRVGGGDQPVCIQQVGPGALCAPADVVGLEADAGDGGGGERGLGRLALLGHRADGDVDLRRGAGLLDLLGRLRAVATVGGSSAVSHVTVRRPAEPENPVR